MQRLQWSMQKESQNNLYGSKVDLSVMKSVHCICCGVSKQKDSVVSLCMTEDDIPFGEYLAHLSWKDIAK